MRSNGKRMAIGLALAALLGAGALSAHAVWMQAKAWLAQHLIADAWRETLAGEQAVRPWPWADTWPVARLTTPDGDPLYVLSGLSGHALAFGPARPAAGPAAGEPGTTVIAGHKDSHFRFLRTLAVGQVFTIQTASGQTLRYRVQRTRIADSREESLPVHPERDDVVLVTCYPFGAGRYDSPLRYLVRGQRL